MNFSPARSRYDCDIISQERRFIIKKGGIRIFRADNLDGWRDGQSEQVQRTESFNLIYRFDRAATICVKRDLSNLLSLSLSLSLSLCLSRAKFMDFHTDSADRSDHEHLSSRFVSPALSRSPLVFSPLSSFPFFFLGPRRRRALPRIVFSRTHAEAAFIKSDTL